MINSFKVFYETVVRIQRFYRRSLEASSVRRLTLVDMFEKEQKSMQKYYLEKAKKNKKMKQTYQLLCGITKEGRDHVLDRFYDNKIV